MNWFQAPPEATRGAGERRGGRRRCAGPRCSPRPPPPRAAPLPALLAEPAGRRSRGWHRHGNLREKERKPVSPPSLFRCPAPRGGGTVPRRGAGCGPAAGGGGGGPRGRTPPRLRASGARPGRWGRVRRAAAALPPAAGLAGPSVGRGGAAVRAPRSGGGRGPPGWEREGRKRRGRAGVWGDFVSPF